MDWKRGLGFVFLALAILILIDTLLALFGLLNESTNPYRDVVGMVLFAALAWFMFRMSKKN